MPQGEREKSVRERLDRQKLRKKERGVDRGKRQT
jgi:hypothetical protein